MSRSELLIATLFTSFGSGFASGVLIMQKEFDVDKAIIVVILMLATIACISGLVEEEQSGSEMDHV